MLDANLMLRQTSDGDLDSTPETGAAVDFGSGDTKPMNYLMTVPSMSGTGGPTLTVEIQDSDDGSSGWHTFCTLPPVNSAPAFKTRSVRSAKRYRRYVATLTGTTPNFGAVTIGCDPSGKFWGV